MMKRALFLVLFVLPGLLDAQSLVYNDFSSIAGLTLNGSATQHNSLHLRLNPATSFQKGSFFHDQVLLVSQGFDTTFSFQMNAQSAGGADGMAFVIHNDPRGDTMLGNDGSDLGYGGSQAVVNALVIEIDTYGGGNGTGYGDSSDNEISVHCGGTGPCTVSEGLSLGRATPAVNLSDGNPHQLRVVHYLGTLEIFVDGAATPELSIPFDFGLGGAYAVAPGLCPPPNLFLSDFGWVGFTAATGSATESHRIDSWTWTSPLQGPAWTGAVGSGLGGPYDVVQVNGSSGGTGRSVWVPVAATFTIDVLQPPSNPAPAGFYLAAMLGRPEPGWTANILNLGPTAFPFPVPFSQPPLYHILVDTFGFTLPSLYATPAPWSFTVTGGFPAPHEFTMQGVIEQTVGVVAITNALRVVIQ